MRPCSSLLLFIDDDSGSREPDNKPTTNRNDQLDYFALGGVLIHEERIEEVKQKHTAFCQRQGINYPLHSSAIQGGRRNFGWLKQPERARSFFADMDDFLVDLPILGIAAVIDRPGYVARYHNAYQEQLWFMCKTAYSILIERAAKYADSQDCKLRVFFEETGKREDRDIISYARTLKTEEMPFNKSTSGGYGALQAEDFQRLVLGEPKRRSKKHP